jgi:hypothetical protein
MINIGPFGGSNSEATWIPLIHISMALVALNQAIIRHVIEEITEVTR